MSTAAVKRVYGKREPLNGVDAVPCAGEERFVPVTIPGTVDTSGMVGTGSDLKGLP